jgi:hypothetical protein
MLNQTFAELSWATLVFSGILFLTVPFFPGPKGTREEREKRIAELEVLFLRWNLFSLVVIGLCKIVHWIFSELSSERQD